MWRVDFSTGVGCTVKHAGTGYVCVTRVATAKTKNHHGKILTVAFPAFLYKIFTALLETGWYRPCTNFLSESLQRSAAVKKGRHEGSSWDLPGLQEQS